ncbi:hypothetical protein [Maribacter sp. 2210JD10-5]|uniref:hypothetical protein n=1 Tax=Maribacter sp. 2210JD10-5 TaxID=3386272 RepID=UPI0039BCF83F
MYTKNAIRIFENPKYDTMVAPKPYLSSLWLLCIATTLHAQLKIGDNVSTINEASILELESTSKVLVLTRISNSQMQALNPLRGAMAFNTDTGCVHYYDGNAWLNLCNQANSPGNFTDNQDGTFTYTDGSGQETTFFGNPETVTQLRDNLDGTYTYINEEGTEATINSIAGTDSQNLSTNGFAGNITISNGNTLDINVDDADASDTNEIQNLNFNDGVISLSQDPTNTLIDLSGYDTNATDDFSGSFNDLVDVPDGLADGDDNTQLTEAEVAAAVNNQFPNLDTDDEDDFSGNFEDLANIPDGLADGDDNTQLSKEDIEALGFVEGEHTVDTQLTEAEVATAVNNQFPNLDTDNQDDFSGSFNDLADVPDGLADGDDNTQLSKEDIEALGFVEGEHTVDTQLTEAEVAAAVSNQFPNLDTDDEDDFSGSFNDLTDVPDGLADGDDNTQLSKEDIEALGFVEGEHTVDTQLTEAEVAAAVNNQFPNLDTDDEDDFSGNFEDLSNIPDGLADGDDNTQLSKEDIEALGFVDGEHTVDTQLTEAEVAAAVNNQFPNLDTDDQDDFSGSFEDLADVPDGLADGDDNTQLSKEDIEALGFVEGEHTVDTRLTEAEVATAVNNQFPNLDTDDQDDFSGNFEDLANIPDGLADGDDNTQLSKEDIEALGFVEGEHTVDTQLTEAEVAAAVNSQFPNLDVDITDDFSGSFEDLADVPDGLADGDDVDDDDNDASNEIQTLSVTDNELTISGTGGNTITLPTNDDADWYQATTTNAATDINQNIFTNGNIGVGTNDPTSTVAISGSFATGILRTTGSLTLNNTHHTIILGGNHTITLPTASSCTGRMYIIKNTSSTATTISTYVDQKGSNTTSVDEESIIWLQSDGMEWQLINNIGGAGATTGGGGPNGTTGTLTTELVSDFMDDGQNGPTNTFQLQIRNTTGNAISYEALIENAPYATIPSLNLGNHTYQVIDNGNGTFNHIFTSTTSLAGFQSRTITGGNNISPPGTGLACGCVSFYKL